MKRLIHVFWTIIITIIIAGCSKQESGEAPAADALISAHTSGTISRESPIRIRFITQVVDSSRIGVPVEPSPLKFNPRIRGMTVWSDLHTLEFQPNERLPQGQRYTATLRLSKLMETPKGADKYSFQFATMHQSIEINIDGLQTPDRRNPGRQRLQGRIITADAEYGMDVESILTAKQEGNELSISWQHDESQRVHRFTINDIVRGEADSRVTLKWDGKSIGVGQKGERHVDIPAASRFQVTGARAVQGDQQYIEIRFTDPLSERQNLRGLIRADERDNLRFTIAGNVLQVFQNDRWSGEVSLEVEPGIRNSSGYRLSEGASYTVHFSEILPQVRFAGKGVILPTTQGLTLPIEVVNLRSVIVEALRVNEQNMPQFFQTNDMEGDRELRRVGRVVWKKRVDLDMTPDQQNRWVRYGLDVSPLVQNNPGGLYRLTLTFRQNHIIYPCAETVDEDDDEDESIEEEDWEDESSYWDYWDENFDWSEYYNNRMNPCHPAYYRVYHDHNITVTRNFLISDLGLIAKRGTNDTLAVAVSDLRTTHPLSDVSLKLLDFQQNIMATASTDGDGMAILPADRKPFLLIAENRNQKGYLKLNDGASLSVSHFDVAGASVQKGMKGFLYGERGVWRPGDALYLTFILMDTENRLPRNHPIRFELLNPRGQRIQTRTLTQGMNGFYHFYFTTSPDAPTGNWLARIQVGGVTFEKTLKIETVMPNRLKIGLDFGEGVKSLSTGSISGTLSSTWLHGAIARNLNADVDLEFTPRRAAFPGLNDFVFDDPVRIYEPESRIIFDDELDNQGKASVNATLRTDQFPPGMLNANFTSRVFEPGGAFSTDRYSIPFHPYDRYVGLRTPKGDRTRGMLLTDTTHTVNLAVVDSDGQPQPDSRVEISLYKIKWRWWWEKGSETLADYVGTSSYQAMEVDTVTLSDGQGTWPLRIAYPAWGRYLIRARDLDGDHVSGQIVYIDWPGWAGRAQKDSPGGAGVLMFESDKTQYQVGDKVVLTIPTGKQGRGLVSIESGSKVLMSEWITAGSGNEPTRFEFKTTSQMAPNVYATVTFLQPHLQAGNDLPIRMHGVIPIKVLDTKTKLEPLIESPDVFPPQETTEIKVKEANGKPMTYTLAVVDEGLLDLTRFATPDPWNFFYQREALGVKTWDVYDWVTGAYSGSLEKLLAIGGGFGMEEPVKQRANRFPPMVRFYGPFNLKKKKTNKHAIDIPQYVGAVRVMVVAGQDKAFGSTDKSVFVRKPLMVLGTLPRVLSPNEDVELPVSVFALEENIRNVNVSVQAEGAISLTGSNRHQLTYTDIGDQIAGFRIKAGASPGIGKVTITAQGHGETAIQTIEIDVRQPTQPVVDVLSKTVEPGRSWRTDITLPGMSGTNTALLEVSKMPPMNLGKRLGFLIRYPHGCVEQTISAAFPQLYLDQVLALSPEKQDNVENNVKGAIQKLSTFQHTDGGFGYWPGMNAADAWSTNYAGHFIIEAKRMGYTLPPGMIQKWTNYQRGQAHAWVTGPERAALIQAYRLYTLALADSPELGAMNRMKEMDDLPTTAKWRLAAAYQLAGQPEAAQSLMRGPIRVDAYRELSGTFGSDLRDKAMILETLCIMDDVNRAKNLVEEISENLSSEKWLSTQTTAYALIAMSRYAGIGDLKGDSKFSYEWNREDKREINIEKSIVQLDLSVDMDTTAIIKLDNATDQPLYARIISEGLPRMGRERYASNELQVQVTYRSMEGDEIDITRLDQGTDIIADVTVKNTGRTGTYEELALSHLVPSGWEIHNTRLFGGDSETKLFDYQDIRDDRVYTYFDLKQGQEKIFQLLLNASYLGRFYAPSVGCEAMYDAAINGRQPGQWIEVVRPGN